MISQKTLLQNRDMNSNVFIIFIITETGIKKFLNEDSSVSSTYF